MEFRGNEVMAYVGAKLGVAMAANVTAVVPGDDYHITRLRWGGSLLEEARLKGEPKLLTVAPLAVVAEMAGEERVEVRPKVFLSSIPSSKQWLRRAPMRR